MVVCRLLFRMTTRVLVSQLQLLGLLGKLVNFFDTFDKQYGDLSKDSFRPIRVIFLSLQVGGLRVRPN